MLKMVNWNLSEMENWNLSEMKKLKSLRKLNRNQSENPPTLTLRNWSTWKPQHAYMQLQHTENKLLKEDLIQTFRKYQFQLDYQLMPMTWKTLESYVFAPRIWALRSLICLPDLLYKRKMLQGKNLCVSWKHWSRLSSEVQPVGKITQPTIIGPDNPTWYQLPTSLDLDWAQKSKKGRRSMRVMEGWWWVSLCVCMYVCACTGVSLW